MAKVTPTGATTRLRSRGRLHVMLRKGQLVARAWPRKRGKPTHPVVQAQNAWFAQAARLASRVDPHQAKLAIEVTKDTGLLPRDILMAAMAANLYDLELEDGRIITKRPNRLYPVMFQGFMLQLAVNQVLPLNTLTTLAWPLPVRDTAGFWNPAEPDRITIPPGVKQMIFFAGWQGALGSNARHFLQIRNPPNIQSARTDHPDGANCSLAISTGPVEVTPGEQWTWEIFQSGHYDAIGFPSTFFSGQVIGTDPV